MYTVEIDDGITHRALIVWSGNTLEFHSLFTSVQCAGNAQVTVVNLQHLRRHYTLLICLPIPDYMIKCYVIKMHLHHDLSVPTGKTN